jgi:hypothetical protein
LAGVYNVAPSKKSQHNLAPRALASKKKRRGKMSKPKEIVPLPDNMLLVAFEDGDTRVYDMEQLAEEIRPKGRAIDEIIKNAAKPHGPAELKPLYVSCPNLVQAIPLPDMMLLLVFENGAIKMWDAHEMLDESRYGEGSLFGVKPFEHHQKLLDERFFRNVRVSRRGLFWDENIDVQVDRIYFNSPTVINRDPSIGDPYLTAMAANIHDGLFSHPHIKTALFKIPVHTIGELLEVPDERILAVKGIGKKTFDEIKGIRERIRETLPSPPGMGQ